MIGRRGERGRIATPISHEISGAWAVIFMATNDVTERVVYKRNKLQQISARKTPISHSRPASRRVGLSTCISNMQPRLHPDRRDYRLAVEAGRYRQRRTDGTMNLPVRPVSSAANRRKTAGRW